MPKSFNESKTTTQVQGRTSKDADGNKISTYEFDLYTVDDEQIASNIFEFLAKNSDVEWSNTKVSSKDNTSFNLISTSHKEGSEVGMRYTFEKYKNTPVRDKDLLRKVPIAYSFQCARAVPLAYSRRNSMQLMPHKDS